jgi:hypothetical protein
MSDISHKQLKDEIERLETELQRVSNNQDKLLSEWSRYKGFFGGIVFTISAISAAVGLLWDYIKVKLS